MKKVLGIVVVLAVIAVILWLIFGKGIGFGNGDGNGEGTVTEESSSESAEAEERSLPQEDEAANEDTDESDNEKILPDKITVIIQEDKVFVEDKQFEDADTLKEYIEEINSDSRVFYLEDKDSILATREWVEGVFEELQIKLMK